MNPMIQKTGVWNQEIEWSNFLFIVLTPLFSIVGVIWLFSTGGVHGATWILAFVMLMATGLGVTAGYHRLFSHKTYHASWPIRLILLLLGGASFEGSAREWCSAHRKHHRFVDKDGDPYNIKKGFWYAHVGWVIFKSDQSDESGIKDLLADPLIIFQDRYYIPLAVAVCFALPMMLGTLWGDPWGGLIIAGLTRMVVNHHLTFLINSYAHYFGRQTYADSNTSRDSGVLALLTYGEGYHNFHHAFPGDFRNGVRLFHFDPAKWLIRILASINLVSHLKQVPQQTILKARMRMDEKKLREFAERWKFPNEWDQWVVKTRIRVEQIHARFIELKNEYDHLKQEKLQTMVEKLDQIRNEYEKTKQELKEAMTVWQMMVNRKMIPLPART